MWARTPWSRSTAGLHQSTLGAGSEQTWHSRAPSQGHEWAEPAAQMSGPSPPPSSGCLSSRQQPSCCPCLISQQWNCLSVNLMLDIHSVAVDQFEKNECYESQCWVLCLVCWNCIMQWLQWPLCENPGANVPFLLPTCSSSERLLWTFSSWPCIVPTSSFLLNDSVLLQVKTFLGP